MNIIAQRVFNPSYILFDSIFLIVLCALLIIKKRYLTLLFGLAGGVLYMLVDYGIFHLILGTRSIQNGNIFGVLLWMSFSYGITNFSLIWIWISKDKLFVEFTAAVWIWWICCPMISALVNLGEPIIIQRTTASYHGYMAIIMAVSYFAVIFYNVMQQNKQHRFNIVWLFAMGVFIQLAWETGLLIGGIRSAQFGVYDKIMTLIINSLVETNLGLPIIYVIFLAISSRLNENLTRREKISFKESLALNNSLRYRKFNNKNKED